LTGRLIFFLRGIYLSFKDMNTPFTKLPLAMTDIETTGLNPMVHEIIEIGCVILNPQTGETINEFEVKIAPLRISDAHPKALEVNGYRQEDWRYAVSLQDGLQQYADTIRGSVFCAQNATFDWSFLSNAFGREYINLDIDYHRLDLVSLSYAKLRDKGVMKYNLNSLAEFFNIAPEPFPHRALTGARIAAQVYTRLMING